MTASLASGIYWVGISMFLSHAARALGILVLAAMLSPVDFGMYAALFLFVDGLSMIQGFGLGHAVVVDRSGDDSSIDTAFLLSVAIAIVLFLVGLASADLIETLTTLEGIATPFTICCSLVLIQALRIIPAKLFERDLDFRKLFLPTLASAIGFLGVSIPLAISGAGVWSLVCGQIASAGAGMIVVWILTSYRPQWRFRKEHARAHLTFGWTVLGGTVLHYLIRSVDRFALSRSAGAEELGTYAFAFSLATLPSMFFVRIVNTVLFPNYAALAEQGRRNELFCAATRITTGLSLWFLVIASFSAGPLLGLIYGHKWNDAAIPVAILAFAAFLRTQNSMLCDLFIGSKRPALFRWINFVQLGTAVAVILTLTTKNSISVATAMSVGGLMGLLVGFASASIVSLNRRSYLACWVSPLLAVGVSTITWTVGLRFFPTPTWTGTLAVLVLGSVTYMAVWLASDRPSRMVLTNAAIARFPSLQGRRP